MSIEIISIQNGGSWGVGKTRSVTAYINETAYITVDTYTITGQNGTIPIWSITGTLITENISEIIGISTNNTEDGSEIFLTPSSTDISGMGGDVVYTNTFPAATTIPPLEIGNTATATQTQTRTGNKIYYFDIPSGQTPGTYYIKYNTIVGTV
jgi:hypothetical protein